MKDQQFDQQVKILRLHHRDIQEGIKKLNEFATESKKSEAKHEAGQVSAMTYQLFKYCEKLLHTSVDQSRKCHNLKQRLMKQFTEIKLTKEKLMKYESKLLETERKMEMMLKQKREVQAVNAHLRQQIKLAGFITSFTFKEDSTLKGKPPRLQNLEINSLSESEVTEASIDSLSEQEEMQLYVSALDEQEINQANKLANELAEVEEEFLKEVEGLQKNSTEDTDKKQVEPNQ